MIRNFYFFLIFSFIFTFLTSCGTVKEGFSMKKKNSNEEFLVQKKTPLIMPPNYDELPVPKSSENNQQEESEIKELIVKTKKDNPSSDRSKNNKGNLEESLLEKIKNN